MSNITSFEDYKEENTPYTVQELICLKCLSRWIGAFPTGTNLKEIECPNCGEIGYVIATGQEIVEVEE